MVRKHNKNGLNEENVLWCKLVLHFVANTTDSNKGYLATNILNTIHIFPVCIGSVLLSYYYIVLCCVCKW